MTFYVPVQEPPEHLCQGDLLEGIPFISARFALAEVPGDTEWAEDQNLFNGPDTGHLLAPYERAWGIVVSQSCDLDRSGNRQSSPILVARCHRPRDLNHEALEHTEPSKRHAEIRKLAKPGDYPALFYLPSTVNGSEQSPRLIALLSDVQRFLVEDYDELRSRLRFRLTPDALRSFQARLAHFSGRFADDDYLALDDGEAEYLRERTANQARAAGRG